MMLHSRSPHLSKVLEKLTKHPKIHDKTLKELLNGIPEEDANELVYLLDSEQGTRVREMFSRYPYLVSDF